MFASTKPDGSRRNSTASAVAVQSAAGTSAQVAANSTTSVPLLPASYRTPEDNIGVPRHDVFTYLSRELNVERLNNVHTWLRIVGRPMPPRALHRQKMMFREIVITEQMDLHLVWSGKQIFVKPVPRFLLDIEFWGDRCQLYRCALGFLLSYAALISYESDYAIAQEERLLPREVTWSLWVSLVEQLLDRRNLTNINKRYVYGELRLSRLNQIHRFREGKLIRGYLYRYNQYSVFFRANFRQLITIFAYITIVLSAMQVGLATTKLQDNERFQQAAYGFTVFSILAPLIALGIAAFLFVLLFVANLIATLMYRKQRFPSPEQMHPKSRV